MVQYKIILASLLLMLTTSVTQADTQVAKKTVTTGYWQEMTRNEALHKGKARTGKEVYEYRCYGCHGKNTQGAPMPGDRYEWAKREEKGMKILLQHAVNGYGVYMPPRGGCRDCREDELQAAIKYMLAQTEIQLYLPKTEPKSAAR